MAVQFGVVSSATTYGIAESVERSQSVDEAVYRDANGHVTGNKTYNKTEEVTIQATYDSAATLPVIGNNVSLTINGVATIYTVTDVKDVESNEDYRKVTVTAHRYINNTIPAAVTT